MRTRREFRRIWNQALSDRRHWTVDDISRNVKSRNADSRLRALFKMRGQLTTKPPQRYFSLAKGLLDDTDNDCRWQSLIVIGEYIHTRPLDVWPLIAKHGNSDDEDMRTAIATVLLEHLLENHFERFYSRVKREAIRSPMFADTLSRCWPTWQSNRDGRKLKNVLQQVRR